MDVSEHVAALEVQGRALASAAEQAGPDAAVPTCPGWTVRDLVAHTAGVHDWAASFVRADPDAEQERELPPARPGEDVVARYRTALTGLVAALRAAPGELVTWIFLPAPSPLAFWARRQSHEAAIHRADAEAAAGSSVTYPRGFALDGIRELLLGFHARRGRRLRSERPRRLLIAPDDAPESWLAAIGPEGCRTELAGPVPDADCTLRGSASDLYLALWNRPAAARVEGDPGVLDLWGERARVTWS
ncbi:maleylpyruvate isomerase family mycothiol-dependent enzyme [Pseudonocardia sp. DLS-67]